MLKNKSTHWSLPIALLSVCSLAMPSAAETWSDSTGQFKIDAEFLGVDGTSIVLKKADGSSIKVPIARLSTASRDRAKKLYTQQKNGKPASTASSEAQPSIEQASVNVPIESSGSDLSKLRDVAPQPAAVDPLPAFPENASLQQTVDFVQTQLMAGHPEVFWHALPSEIRERIDSEAIRAKVGPFLKEQAAAGKQNQAVIIKAIDVLITKKEFVLNSPLTSQIPPNFLPMVKQGYDPAVGLVYELFAFSDAVENVQDRSIENLVDEHGPRIGGHLKSLIALVPPELVDGVRNSVVASETDDSNGTVTVASPQGEPAHTEFVRYQDRWIPKSLADAWEANQDDLEQQLESGMEFANEQSAQAMMMSAMFMGMANSVLEPLAAASTQEEFDQAIAQLMQTATSMQQNMPGGGATQGIGAPGGF